MILLLLLIKRKGDRSVYAAWDDDTKILLVLRFTKLN